MCPESPTSGKEGKCQNSLVFFVCNKNKIINRKVCKLRREKYRKIIYYYKVEGLKNI